MPVVERVRLYANERTVVLPLKKSPRGYSYAITNYGRVISFTTAPEEGHFLKLVTVSNYPGFSVRPKDKSMTFMVHRLVAKHFLKQASPLHKYVIHLNYKKDDNFYQNLKWVTHQEKVEHAAKNHLRARIGRQKLTAGRVRMIKEKLLNGKTRLKMIAKQFGVSDMQIHRIKTGENWGYVKVISLGESDQKST